MRQQWVFANVMYDEKPGTVTVQRNSGHDSFRINYETNVITAGDFIYYATWRGEDGKREKFAISREGLEKLRNRPDPVER